MFSPLTFRTVAALGAALGLAAAATAAPSLTASAETTYATRYIFRGMKLGGAALQPSVTLGYGNFSLNTWWNEPLDGDENNERDYVLAYAGGTDALEWSVGAQYYDYPQALAPATRRSLELTLGVTKRITATVGATLLLARDVRLDATTVEAGLNRAIEFTAFRRETTLTLAAVAGGVHASNLTPDDEGAPRVGDDYTYVAVRGECEQPLGRGAFARLCIQWDGARGLNSGEFDLAGNVSALLTLGWSW